MPPICIKGRDLLRDVDYEQFRLCSCVKISEAGRQLHVSNYPIPAWPSQPYHPLTHLLYLSAFGCFVSFEIHSCHTLSSTLSHSLCTHYCTVSHAVYGIVTHKFENPFLSMDNKLTSMLSGWADIPLQSAEWLSSLFSGTFTGSLFDSTAIERNQ